MSCEIKAVMEDATIVDGAVDVEDHKMGGIMLPKLETNHDQSARFMG